MFLIISFFLYSELITLSEIILPFCLFPILTVGMPRLGVSSTPLEEFPITALEIFVFTCKI